MKKLTVAMTKADKMVIRVLVCVIVLSFEVVLLTACSREDDVPDGASDVRVRIEKDDAYADTTVTISFAPPYDIRPMGTRAATSIADVCTRLDVWITDGETTTPYQQESTDDGFGTVTATLSSTKEYTLYAVAHRSSVGHATLADDIISFAEDKLSHSFFVSRTFTPTASTTLNLEMQRIVAQFQFKTTDQAPDWCKTVRFTISGIYDRWHVTDGGTHQLDRVSTFENFSRKQDGTVTFNIYAIVTASQTLHDILVEGIDADGEVQESHQFIDVPLRNNYRTVATGAFFTDRASGFSFLAEEWAGDLDYTF